MAHYLICNQIRDFPEDYSEKMILAMDDSIPDFVSLMDNKTATCVREASVNQIYEHFCGENRKFNMENFLSFVAFLFEDSSSEFERKVAKVAEILLSGQIFDKILTRIQPWCPKKSDDNYFPRSQLDLNEQIVELSENIASKTFHSRQKRLYDDFEVMKLFNKVLCLQNVRDSLSRYWDENVFKLRYSRVWIMGVASEIWCCVVDNIQRLYD